jgi:hypothetical protein
MGTVNGLPRAIALRCSDILPLRTTYKQAYAATRNCFQSGSSVMLAQKMESVIHFKHAPEEIIDLELAIPPLADSIRRVSTWQCRSSMKRILNGEFFRAPEANTVKNMLLRAVKFSRAHLDEYFPSMRAEVLEQSQILEDACQRYWRNFERLRQETLPTH